MVCGFVFRLSYLEHIFGVLACRAAAVVRDNEACAQRDRAAGWLFDDKSDGAWKTKLGRARVMAIAIATTITCVCAAHVAGVLQPLFEVGSIGSTLRNTHTQQRHALQKRYIFALHNALARTGFKLLQDGGGGQVLRRDATAMPRSK